MRSALPALRQASKRSLALAITFLTMGLVGLVIPASASAMLKQVMGIGITVMVIMGIAVSGSLSAHPGGHGDIRLPSITRHG